MAIVVTALCFLVYGTVQQDLRQSANDPQIQMAEDTAHALDNNADVSQFSFPKIEMSKSLAPFVMMYDVAGKVIGGNGVLHGVIPELPAGIFDSVKNAGEDRITWQPESNVRIALVVVPYQNGFVAVGRSLREVELREQKTFIMATLVWLCTLLATFVFAFIFDII